MEGKGGWRGMGDGGGWVMEGKGDGRKKDGGEMEREG